MPYPVAFVGHGSPMLALEDSPTTRTLRSMGEALLASYGKPEAILMVSAHWFSQGTRVQTSPAPEQVYDMYGFPKALYDVVYPAKGSPVLGNKVLELMQDLPALEENSWGIDHGAWTVLVHMFPEADIPVVQLSIDRTQTDPAFHYRIGKQLHPLRDQGVFIMGSGNIVHNLRQVQWDLDQGLPLADVFDGEIREAVRAADDATVLAYHDLAGADFAVPTMDHFLPLVYCLGAREEGEALTVFNDRRTLGALSMTSYLWQT